MESSSSSSVASEDLIQTLVSRGWCFGDVERVKALIVVQFALHGGSCTVDLVESELANMDLGSVGGKSLPDASLLRKSSYLQGPKVLQVRLENKAPVRSGIVCLNPKVVTVLGGVVQILYEEWQMNQKYSGSARSSLMTSKESDTGGAPPFEKLEIGAVSRQGPQGRSWSTSSSFGPTVLVEDGTSESRKINRLHNSDSKEDDMDNEAKSASSTGRSEEKPSSSEARPKQVVEAVPVHNQAAAQKLLQKLNHPNLDNRHSRGQKHRGKGRREELQVFTLDEWEMRKAGGNLSVRDELAGVNQDEDLARQLQNQFDLEDHQIQRAPRDSDAENIKMSMFSFQREDPGSHNGTGFRGRGRGRVRGRGRGRFS